MTHAPSQHEIREAALRNYDGAAAHYERQLVTECGYTTPQRVATVLDARGATQGSYLDLGAGTGLVGRAIRDTRSSVRLSAVDNSHAMLERIDDSVYVDKHCIDVLLPLPFPASSFDGAFAVGLLDHIVEPATLFGHVRDVVRPGGLFVVTFSPTRASSVELYDQGAAALAHSLDAVAHALEKTDFVVRSESEGPAYRDGDSWVTHVLVVAERA